MSKIYVGQTKLVLNAFVGEPLTGQQTCLIKYIKPDLTAGSFTASTVNEETGKISYQVATNDLDQAGVWTFWAYVTYTDAKEIAGEPDKITVYAEGT